jgi:hypothetical protein
VASAAMVFNAVWRSPGPSAAGLLVILAGVPLYWFFRRRSVAGPADAPGAPRELGLERENR